MNTHLRTLLLGDLCSGTADMKAKGTYVDKCNACPSSSLVISKTVTISTNNCTDNHERDARPSRTAHEQWPAADVVDEEERGEGGETVDNAVHACREE
jgi:hypothetical protein